MNIHRALELLGVGRRFIGYAALVKASELITEDESRPYCVSKRLYPQIARSLNCAAGCVERNIRTVSDHVWQTNPQKLKELAGYELTHAPTVKEFLDILICCLLREQEGR